MTLDGHVRGSWGIRLAPCSLRKGTLSTGWNRLTLTAGRIDVLPVDHPQGTGTTEQPPVTAPVGKKTVGAREDPIEGAAEILHENHTANVNVNVKVRGEFHVCQAGCRPFSGPGFVADAVT